MADTDHHTDDLRLVGSAYRRERVAGHGDREAYHAALAAYLEQNPHLPADKAGETVSHLIFEAAEKDPAWLHGR
jgi:hypothetical protein